MAYVDVLDNEINESFFSLYLVANRCLIKSMRQCVVRLGVDLESVFILGSLAKMNDARFQRWYGAQPVMVCMQSIGHDFRPVAATLAEVARATGMPRESVRRKLGILQKSGLVVRTHAGGWQVSREEIDDRVREVTRHMVHNHLEAAREIQVILKRSPD